MAFTKRAAAWLPFFCCLAGAYAGSFADAARAQSHARPDPEPASGRVAKTSVAAKHYLISAAHPLAAEAGAALLARGGHAIDAAIAAALVLNVVEPQSSGIGGGGFILNYTAKDQTLTTYDGRETAPATARADRFIGADGHTLRFLDAVVGGRSVGTPGLLRALELAHAKHGRLPWNELFRPAIRLASQGFPLSPRLHALLERVRLPGRNAAMRRLYYRDDDTPMPVGTRLTNPELAHALGMIARAGANAFYGGEIASDLVQAVASAVNPGDLAPADLATYRALERRPVCAPYRRWKVCGMAPPSSGGLAVLQTLGLLERAAPAGIPRNQPQAAHFAAEAERLAFADRDRYVADPAFVDLPAAGMLDPGYLTRRAALIDANKTMGRALPGSPPGAQAARQADDVAPELGSTSHVSVVDAEGNAVAMTSSIEFAFGSQQMARGFLLNNQLTDFSFVAERDGKPVANRVQAGKRPRSSMAPTMVFDANGRLVLLLGSAGGSAIINHVVKTIVAVLDWDMDIQEAIDYPNFGSRNGPTELERGSAAESWAGGLRLLGHELRVQEVTSGVHAIVRSAEGWRGGADSRREGAVRGD